jgi:hypothetical protein
MSAVRAVVVDSVNTSIVYAGTAGGVYVTTDGGLSWNPFNDGLGSTDILALALRSGPGGQLFAGTNGRGLFRTVPLAGLGSEGAAAGLRGAGLSIDPNPATGGLAAIRLSPFAMGHSPCAVGIFDAAGRCVRSAVCNLESEMTLDIRGLRPGVYLVKLESTGFTAARKLVVQR